MTYVILLLICGDWNHSHIYSEIYNTEMVTNHNSQCAVWLIFKLFTLSYLTLSSNRPFPFGNIREWKYM